MTGRIEIINDIVENIIMLHFDCTAKNYLHYLGKSGIERLINDYITSGDIPDELREDITKRVFSQLDEFVFEKTIYQQWIAKYIHWNDTCVSKFELSNS